MEWYYRAINTNDWITLMIISGYIILVVSKIIHPARFQSFMMLFFSGKYITTHYKPTKSGTAFKILLFAFQCISISMFIYLCLYTFDYKRGFDGFYLYVVIAIVYAIFVFGKIIVEKIIAFIFAIDELIQRYIFYKMSYRHYLSLFLLPICGFHFYRTPVSVFNLKIYLIVLGILNIMLLFFVFKKNVTLISSHLFYFILYLCTLELAPYLILYKLIE